MSTDGTMIHEFRHKTLTRIMDKRRQLENQELRRKEADRAIENAFRTNWRENVKSKRNKEVIDAVDRHLIKSVVGKSSAAVPSSSSQQMGAKSFLEEKDANENDLHSLTADLILADDLPTYDHQRDSGNFTLSLHSMSKQASYEFTNTYGHIPESIRYLRRIGAHGLKIQDRLDKIWNSDRDASYPMSENSNQMQISTMLNDLLGCDGRSQLKNGRAQTGFMLKVLQEAHTDIAGLGPGSMQMFTPMSLMPANENDHRARPATASKSGKPGPPTHNRLFSELVENCFVIGPDQQQILSYLQSVLASNPSEPLSPHGRRPSVTASALTQSVRGFVLPSILFQSDNDYPPEMMTLLPSYCYPSGAEIQILPSTRGDPTARKMSVGQASQTPTQTELTRKKMKVFFNSDHGINPDAGDDNRPTDAYASPSNASPTLIGFPSNSGMASKQPFVLVLGDHTYQQFCIGQIFAVSFFDRTSNLIVHTTYTLCMLTKFPFFPYLSYVATQFEDDLRFMLFDTPLPVFDPNFPLNSQLRLLHDLFLRVNRVLCPLYPSLVSNHRPTLTDGEARAFVPSSPTAGLTEDQDYTAIIPDVGVKLHLKNEDRNLVDFKRSLYQIFYSQHARSDELSDALLAGIKYHEKFKKDFIPSSLHKLEKDREDTFLILQWALPTLLKYLPLDQVILCLGCAVTEMKIIVKHKDVHVVSSIILALVHLLRPLKWCSPVIVTLPDDLKDLVESPVPIMLGMLKLPSDFVLMEGYVVVDPQERTVHLHPTDVVQSHTTLLPNASRLIAALRTSAEKILQLTRKRKMQQQKVTITVQHESKLSNSMSTTPLISTINAQRNLSSSSSNIDVTSAGINQTVRSAAKTNEKVISTPQFLPLQLDITNPDAIAFAGAVMQFSSLVSNHILAILNTGIQLQQQAKEAARAKRRVVQPNVMKAMQPQANSPLLQSTPPPPQSKGRNIGGDKLTPNGPSTPQPNTNSPMPTRGANLTPTTPLADIGSVNLADISPKQHSSDDGVSEVTFLDLPETKSDGSNSDNVDHTGSGGGSVASTASSLPSLQSDAPILIIKDIGQNGMKFVNKVLETQMYSNYCQLMKIDRDQWSADGSIYNMNDLTNELSNALSTPETRHRQVLGMDPPPYSREADPFDNENESDNDSQSPRDNDAILSMFEIILAGTIPVSEEQLNVAKANYAQLYSTEFTREKLMRIVPSIPSAVKQLVQDRSKLQAEQDRALESAVAESSHSALSLVDSRLRMCTGLACAGFCNTALCSELCLWQWQKKVQRLRHRQVAYELIARKFEKKPKNVFDDEEPKYRVEFVSQQGSSVRLQPQKHGRETLSQYQQRKAVVTQDIQSKNQGSTQNCPVEVSRTALVSVKAHHKSSNRRQRARRAVTALSLTASPSETVISAQHIKRREFAGEDNQSEYVDALARYYARKERKLVMKHIHRAKAKIYRFVYSFVKYYQMIRFRRSVVVGQAIIRGFLVRSGLLELVETLYHRKQVRYCAKIRIRNYFRANVLRILRNFKRLQEMNLRKKRPSISLPVSGVNSPSSEHGDDGAHKFINEPSLPLGVGAADATGSSAGVHLSVQPVAASGGSHSNGSSGGTGIPTVGVSRSSTNNLHGNSSSSAATSKHSASSNNLTATMHGSAHDGDKHAFSGLNDEEVLMAHKRAANNSFSSKARDFLNFGVVFRKTGNSPNHPVHSRLTSVSSMRRPDIPRPNPEKPRVSGTDTQNSPIAFSSLSTSAPSSPAPSETSAVSVTNLSSPIAPIDLSPTQAESLLEKYPFPTTTSPTSSPIAVSRKRLQSGESRRSPQSVPPMMQSTESIRMSPDLVRPQLTVSIPNPEPADRTLSSTFSISQSPYSRKSSRPFAMSGDLSGRPSLSPTALSRLPSIAENRVIDEDFRFAAAEIPVLPDVYCDSHDEELKIRSEFGLQPLLATSMCDLAVLPSADGHSIKAQIDPQTLQQTSPAHHSHSHHHHSPDGHQHHSHTGHSTDAGPPSNGNGNNSDSDSDSVFDAVSVCTADRSYAHLNRLFPAMSITNLADKASFISSTSSVVSSATSKEIECKVKSKKTPLGRFTAANNYAVSNVVANTSMLTARTASDHRSETQSHASSRSHLTTNSGADDESKSERNTQASWKSDEDLELVAMDQDSKESESDATSSRIGSQDQFLSIKTEELSPAKSALSAASPMASAAAASKSSTAPVSQAASTSPAPMESSSAKSKEKKRLSEVDYENDELNDEEEDGLLLRSAVDVSKEYDSYPMKAFGDQARDHFTTQQVKMIKSMYTLLRQGISVHKHGRKGKPTQKVIYCDLAMSKIYWRNPGAKRDPDEEIDDHAHVPNAHGGTSGAVRRRSGIFGSGRPSSLVVKGDSERQILVRDILSVSSECISEVLQRSISKHYIGIEGCNVMCIVAAGRTLDLEIELEAWEVLFRGLQVVVEFYNQMEHGLSSTLPRTNETAGSLENDLLDFDGNVDSLAYPLLLSSSQSPLGHASSSAPAHGQRVSSPFPLTHQTSESLPKTSTTSLGVKTGIVADSVTGNVESGGLEYDTAGKRKARLAGQFF